MKLGLTIFVDAKVKIMDRDVVDDEEIVRNDLVSSNKDPALSAVKNQVVGDGITGCRMPCLNTVSRDIIHNIIGDISPRRGMVNSLIHVAIGSQGRTDMIDNITNHLVVMIPIIY